MHKYCGTCGAELSDHEVNEAKILGLGGYPLCLSCLPQSDPEAPLTTWELASAIITVVLGAAVVAALLLVRYQP